MNGWLFSNLLLLCCFRQWLLWHIGSCIKFQKSMTISLTWTVQKAHYDNGIFYRKQFWFCCVWLLLNNLGRWIYLVLWTNSYTSIYEGCETFSYSFYCELPKSPWLAFMIIGIKCATKKLFVVLWVGLISLALLKCSYSKAWMNFDCVVESGCEAINDTQSSQQLQFVYSTFPPGSWLYTVVEKDNCWQVVWDGTVRKSGGRMITGFWNMSVFHGIEHVSNEWVQQSYQSTAGWYWLIVSFWPSFVWNVDQFKLNNENSWQGFYSWNGAFHSRMCLVTTLVTTCGSV